MMLRILRDKFFRLGRDDDGVAMVVTLSVFMFMYLVCMGVYAIGTAVKTRIHLQNACDAAAYSAAVVQADTLSRIATINRAMAWTYSQMVKRQMDYISWKWLYHTEKHYKEDAWVAYNAASVMSICPLHECWYIGAQNPYRRYTKLQLPTPYDAEVELNHKHDPTIEYVGDVIDEFESSIGGPSFYTGESSSIGALRNQIDADRETISAMNDAIESLANIILPNTISTTVGDILHANVLGDFEWHVEMANNPYDDYMRVLKGHEEDRFLSFCRNETSYDYIAGKPFNKGSGGTEWFNVTDPGKIMRKYTASGTSPLYSCWNYAAWSWSCDPEEGLHIPTLVFERKSSIQAGTGETRCPCGLRDKYFEGTWMSNGEIDYSRPVVLKWDYFGKNGTITVGIAVRNQNPWTPILGTAIKGIFSAFNIGGDLSWTPQYMVCIASAKAGYKYLREDVENDTRAYRISWEEVHWTDKGQSWNLCQSDWDAVLIPVRRAETFATGKGGVDAIWDGDVGDFLDGYLTQLADSHEMLAGGSKNMDRPEWRDDRGRDLPPDYYRFDQWRRLPLGQSWDWESGNVTAEWQIEGKGNPINWDGLQRVMFH